MTTNLRFLFPVFLKYVVIVFLFLGGGQVRAAQIRLGDREVLVNNAGERVSRLKEVDADWILRRLERWGRRVRLMRLGLLTNREGVVGCYRVLGLGDVRTSRASA